MQHKLLYIILTILFALAATATFGVVRNKLKG